MISMNSKKLTDSGLDILRPKKLAAPVVFSSPHSGRRYPKAFLTQSRLDALALRRSEDSFVDEIFSTVTDFGAPLIRALFPRAYVDANREPFELDPNMFDESLPDYVRTHSSRITSGLGTIPRVVTNGAAIYSAPLTFAEARQRIETHHRPYHRALSALLEETHHKFGATLLIDCHSMPSHHVLGGNHKEIRKVDIVLGDNHGTSCAPEVTSLAEQVLIDTGFNVVRNRPYAGGYITRCYGQPEIGQHSLQVEINRSLYMNERTIQRGPELPGLTRRMGRLIKALTEIKLEILKPKSETIPKAAE